MAKAFPKCGRSHPASSNTTKVVLVLVLMGGCGLMVRECSMFADEVKAKMPSATATGASAPSTPSASPAPPIEITAVQLKRAYDENEVAADDKYKNRRLLVTGSVGSIDKNFMNQIVLHLRTGNEFSTVMANIDKADRSHAAGLKKRDQVTLDCIGGTRIVGSPSLDSCRIR
jgi:hypothetical protein